MLDTLQLDVTGENREDEGPKQASAKDSTKVEAPRKAAPTAKHFRAPVAKSPLTLRNDSVEHMEDGAAQLATKAEGPRKVASTAKHARPPSANAPLTRMEIVRSSLGERRAQ